MSNESFTIGLLQTHWISFLESVIFFWNCIFILFFLILKSWILNLQATTTEILWKNPVEEIADFSPKKIFITDTHNHLTQYSSNFQYITTISSMFTQNISQNNSVQGILTFKTTMCVESNSFFFNKSLLMVAIVAKYFQCVTRLIFNLFGFKVLFQAYTERNIVSSPRKKMGGGG